MDSALKMADLNCGKTKRSKKVRIIGKIRGFTDKEYESLNQDSKPWIIVKNHQENGASEKYTVFLDTQSSSRKEVYKLDYCYEPDEEIAQIYDREIKHLISEAFDGRNASIVALGAKGSGKTQTIQGSQEKPGLAVMAMSEILSKAKELGKSVYVSLYELTQDNAYDLLNPMHPSVQVLENAHGKINLKGLSRVCVKSVSEFHSIYFSPGSSQNSQKIPMELPRNHRGLMVHISSEDGTLKTSMTNKINFVDFAGYEDPGKRSRDVITAAESNRTNKPLYALLNVVSAINANESRVPYRDSKLTRILQDSLGGTSQVLLLTCLKPSFCKDSISSISLLSRSCRSTKQVLTDSTNRSQNSAKIKVQSSLKVGETMSASLSVKKQVSNRQLLSANKATYILKGRKLFKEEKRVNAKQLKCQSEDTVDLVVPPFSLEEASQDKFISECNPTVTEDLKCQGSESQSNLQESLLLISPDDEATIPTKLDVSSHSGIDNPEAFPGANSVPNALMPLVAASTCDEKNISYKRSDASPPVSERIRDISNNLKSLRASTPLRIKMRDEEVAPCSSRIGYNDADPKTPVLELKTASYCSPRGTFSNCSSRVKNSFVQGYLNFLNSANKEELKSLKGIGEKRATYILELREESPEPFKDLDDLQDIGLSAKQIKGIMKQVAGELFV